MTYPFLAHNPNARKLIADQFRIWRQERDRMRWRARFLCYDQRVTLALLKKADDYQRRIARLRDTLMLAQLFANQKPVSQEKTA